VQGTDYQGRVLYAGWVTMEGRKCLGLESESRLAVFFHDWSGCADHHTSFLPHLKYCVCTWSCGPASHDVKDDPMERMLTRITASKFYNLSSASLSNNEQILQFFAGSSIVGY
jgi:hypothetical protein